MIKQNLGTVDRVLRFALAFWWLGPWPVQYSAVRLNWLVVVEGWIALLEAFLGYCWLHELLHIHNRNY